MTGELESKGALSAFGLILALALLCPLAAEAGVILNDTYRAVDAGIEITYTTRDFLGRIETVVVTDDPPMIASTASGSWDESVAASVSGPGGLFFTTYTARASQNSTVSVDASADTLTGEGVTTVHVEDRGSYASGSHPTYSEFHLGFTIDSGDYGYDFSVWRYHPLDSSPYPVSGGLTASGDFGPNEVGVIGPGTYALDVVFENTGQFTNPITSLTEITSDHFSFTVQPYVAPVSAVPEPATMFLLGSALVGLARFRRRAGN